MGDKWVIDPETGEGHSEPMTPEEEAQLAVDRAKGKQRRLGVAFGEAEDTERVRLVNERARADPAFAALVDLTLGREGA